MKIAITADLHLTDRKRNPERFETFENLLADLHAREVGTLIIAGDLFDQVQRNYADFDQICRREENKDIQIFVIPGNHDATINSQDIVADNVTIFTSPTLIPDLGGVPFAFIPYLPGITMGEGITALSEAPPPNRWVLVGHGDLIKGLRLPNQAEPGVYMPLTTTDLEKYKPMQVFLGHIHTPNPELPVHYAGSPLGMDISETGRRTYLLYDTENQSVERPILEASLLFFNETFTIIPVEDEPAYLYEQINTRIAGWKLKPEDFPKVQVRVTVAGYSTNKSAIPSIVREAFAGFRFYKDEEPNIDKVSSSEDKGREFITQQVKARVKDLDWPPGADEPDSDEIFLEALHIIYKR